MTFTDLWHGDLCELPATISVVCDTEFYVIRLDVNPFEGGAEQE